MAAETAAPATGQAGPRHGIRILVIWFVITLVGELLIWFALGPHLPPGTMSSTAKDQQLAITLMSMMSEPVLVLVAVYFPYAMIVWRKRQDDEEDGPPLQGHTGLQAGWIIATTIVVVSLAVYGTVAMYTNNGSGAGEGPAPSIAPAGATVVASQQTTPWTPGQAPLQVQVIGQQWKFTYRYPQFGGFETSALVLPVNQWVQFNVTSLDVIHSFWPYQLGVKADANPGVNNVAFTKPDQTGGFVVRCAELCGLWHGTMTNTGTVVTLAQFESWAQSQEVQLASITKLLPTYATTYNPTQINDLGKVEQQLGLVGAGGGYYPPQDPYQP